MIGVLGTGGVVEVIGVRPTTGGDTGELGVSEIHSAEGAGVGFGADKRSKALRIRSSFFSSSTVRSRSTTGGEAVGALSSLTVYPLGVGSGVGTGFGAEPV